MTSFRFKNRFSEGRCYVIDAALWFFVVYCWLRARAADTMCLVSDWRQIQARIRKARTSADPPGQLAALYERTRDAMVAFELAQIHDKTGDQPEAVRWYTAAAERFRRAQWKQKAEEALTRLGAPIPVALVPIPVTELSAEQPAPRLESNIVEFSEAQVPEAADQPDNTQQETLFGQSIDMSAQPPVAG